MAKYATTVAAVLAALILPAAAMAAPTATVSNVTQTSVTITYTGLTPGTDYRADLLTPSNGALVLSTPFTTVAPPPPSPIPTTWRRFASFETSLTAGVEEFRCNSPYVCSVSGDVGGTDGTKAAKITGTGGSGCSCPRMTFEDGFSYTAGRDVWVKGSWHVPNVTPFQWLRFMNVGHYEANPTYDYYVGLVSEDGRNMKVKARYYDRDTGSSTLIQLGAIPQGRWFTVALHFRFSTIDGQALTEAYVDGQLKGSSTLKNMLGRPLHFFNAGLPNYLGGQMTTYFDAVGLNDTT